MKWGNKDSESIEIDIRKLIREEIESLIREKNLEVFANELSLALSDDNIEGQISKLRAAAQTAQNELYSYISGLCPGPHCLTQHRDGNPAWCPFCSRTKDGILIVRDKQHHAE